MPGNERRIAPRKVCAVPIRFRVVTNGWHGHTDEDAARYGVPTLLTSANSANIEGQALNLSERGVYFTSPEKLSVGQPLEMYFTLPRELTGRSPEHVRCSARVVHVEEETDSRGMRGIGASVERFEPIQTARDWSN